MDTFDTTNHGVLVLGVTASVDQILERVVFSDAHLSANGAKIWNILTPDTGEEIAFMFHNEQDSITMVYMERVEDNYIFPEFIDPREVATISLNGAAFPLADPSQLYLWTEPAHEAAAITVGFNAVNGDVADPSMVDAGRIWFVSLHEGDPVSGLQVLHRMSHEMHLGRILPSAIENPMANAIARVTADSEGDH